MNILEFANPAGFWWAAIALPIVLLYVLKVRLRRQTVSTFLFWDQVFHEKKPRSWWQQLRHLLSLLLQIALLALLVLALVDPLWQWQKTQRRKVLLVIDNSASMAAQDEGRTRLDKARQTAEALVRSLRAGDEMAILAAGGKPEVAIGLTDHSRSLLEAVENIQQSDAPSALAETVQGARRLLVGDTRSSIYVLTDGCDRATESLSQDESVQMIGFGTRQSNQAITQFQVRRSLQDAIGYQTFIEVSNFGDEPYKGRLELNLEQQLVDVVPLEIAAGSSKTLHLDHASATGGRLVARLDTSDGLAVDNVAMAVLPTRQPISVALVTPGSVFLKSVLESIPLVDVRLYQPDLPKSQEDTPQLPTNFVLPADVPRSITILHRLVPAELPAGKLLIIDPQSDSDLWKVGTPIEQPLVATVSDQSPVTQHVKLANVLFPSARALTFASAADLLIKTPLDEPLLAHIRRPNGDVLILNLDLDQGDLPLRIAFPVMMKNALEWFDGSNAELQPALATGSSTSIRLPKPTEASRPVSAPSDLRSHKIDGSIDDDKESAQAAAGNLVQASASQGSTRPESLEVSQYWLRDPRGQLTPLASDTETATLSVLKYAGLWCIGTRADLDSDPWRTDAPKAADDSVSERGATALHSARVTHLACNLSSPEESDLRPKLELRAADQFGMLSLGGRSIWFYCVLIALSLVAVEWWLYQRRIVG